MRNMRLRVRRESIQREGIETRASRASTTGTRSVVLLSPAIRTSRFRSGSRNFRERESGSAAAAASAEASIPVIRNERGAGEGRGVSSYRKYFKPGP